MYSWTEGKEDHKRVAKEKTQFSFKVVVGFFFRVSGFKKLIYLTGFEIG